MSFAHFLRHPGPEIPEPLAVHAAESDRSERLRKQVLGLFAATIALGLALGSLYLGVRIFTARRAIPVSRPVTTAAPVSVIPTTAQPRPQTAAEKPTETPVLRPAPKPVKPATVAAPPAAPPASPAAKRKDSNLPFVRHEANVHPGERYLQIAAYGPRSLDGYLKTLEAQGLHPVVAPGPAENIYRILIGPYPNTAALKEAQAVIEATGIKPILRAY
jgi:hypothetical protein